MRLLPCLLVAAITSACSGQSVRSSELSAVSASPPTAVSPRAGTYDDLGTDCALVVTPGSLATQAELEVGCTSHGRSHAFLVNRCADGTGWTYDSVLQAAGTVGGAWTVAPDDPRMFLAKVCEGHD